MSQAKLSIKYFENKLIESGPINNLDFTKITKEWKISKPFSNIVVDDFLKKSVADQVVSEFPSYEDEKWHEYDNPLEIKKAMNNWDKFGPTTYRLLHFLCSKEFINKLELLTECELYPDFGLNGGGLHTHRSGGKLNTHLDYSMHPKLQYERKINLIIYLTPNWNEHWGGNLGLWEHDAKRNRPGKLIKNILPLFNRAVLFDTSQNSWHGLPEPIRCPTDKYRNSLAVYYLCQPRPTTSHRSKALFSPYKEQHFSKAVHELIRARASSSVAMNTYKVKF